MIIPALTASLLAGPDTTTAPDAIDLAPKAFRTWSIELPADPFRAVSGSIPIAHANGEGFAVEARGVGLAIDTDGDGSLDRVVEGREHPETKVRHARLTLSGETTDGAAFRYPVRLVKAAQGWQWATGGALVGTFDGTRLTVIDLNGNGHYGDVGSDAIVVGGGEVAQFLGETVSIGGTLRSLSVEGATAHVSAFEGETGTLDVHREFDGKGVLLSAVVQSTDGKHSFELSRAEDGLTVPVGSYELVSASLGLGESRVTAKTADMAPLDVESDATCELQWGAPVKASFAYQQSGSEIVLDPAEVEYVGAAGERWVGWDPIGKSPKFEIKEKSTGDVLVDVVFPGSC